MKYYSTISIILFFIINGCQQKPIDSKPQDLIFKELFKDQSVFYNKIPQNPSIDSSSDLMVKSLMESAKQGFLIAVKKWTVTVFYADSTTPRYSVKLTASWSPKKELLDVPIPDFAEPDPSADGSMVVIDESNGCVYDFWQVRFNNKNWKSSWANALPINSDGIFPKGLSARGSGFELLQGLIWPQELMRGEINHALIFSFDYTKAGGPVYPATESDGNSLGDWAIPEGALVQLDPSLNLDSLGLNSYEKTIARALQEYGMYCADNGGGLQLYAVNPLSVSKNPYEHIWGDEKYVFLDRIPVNRFRVLKLGPQSKNDAQLVYNGCNNFK